MDFRASTACSRTLAWNYGRRTESLPPAPWTPQTGRLPGSGRGGADHSDAQGSSRTFAPRGYSKRVGASHTVKRRTFLGKNNTEASSQLVSLIKSGCRLVPIPTSWSHAVLQPWHRAPLRPSSSARGGLCVLPGRAGPAEPSRPASSGNTARLGLSSLPTARGGPQSSHQHIPAQGSPRRTQLGVQDPARAGQLTSGPSCGSAIHEGKTESSAVTHDARWQ